MVAAKHRVEVWRIGTHCANRVQSEFFHKYECAKGEHVEHYNTLCERYYDGDSMVQIVRGDAPKDTRCVVDAVAWAKRVEDARYEHDFYEAVNNVPEGEFVFTALGGYSTPLLHQVAWGVDGPYLREVCMDCVYLWGV